MATTRRGFLATSFASLALAQTPPKARRRRLFSRFDPQVKATLSKMSLDQKVGQMTQPDQLFLKSLDDIEKYHLGSVLSGGDSDPKSGNDLASWTEMYDRHQARALKASPSIPLLYGVDAVHGHNNVIGATVFPQNIGLGCTRNPRLIELAARITSEEIRATGINWAFAPCVAVPQDIRWGRTYEGYGESPELVRELGAAATRGLQRTTLSDPLAVLACSKHYAADGGTTFGTGQPKGKAGERYPLDQGDTRVDEATLRKLHLQGYFATVEEGVGSVMPSYSSWNGVKCSASHRLLTEILKDEMGFEGFLISDYAALNQLSGDYKQQIETSINAGMDMVMVPDKYVEFFENLKALAMEGKVPMSRIDDAVTRILRVKYAMGLMDSKRNHLADRSLQRTFGSPEHRAVARQCVRESLVVLKNSGGVLPVGKNAKVHVAGAAADDIGVQCGGWTIFWQGRKGDITKGTTVLAGIRKLGGSDVAYSADGSGAASGGTAIVVIAEPPYAEMMGDRDNLKLSAEDVALVRRVKQAGAKAVVVILSGRPLIIDEIMGEADAVVAAWLPGTEGDGVAEVLFGTHKPVGKLSFTWPTGESLSLARSDPGYKPLFPFGHGITF